MRHRLVTITTTFVWRHSALISVSTVFSSIKTVMFLAALQTDFEELLKKYLQKHVEQMIRMTHSRESIIWISVWIQNIFKNWGKRGAFSNDCAKELASQSAYILWSTVLWHVLRFPCVSLKFFSICLTMCLKCFISYISLMAPCFPCASVRAVRL